MNKMLVVLQCAYGVTKTRRQQLENRDMWIEGLLNSYTGKRLIKMIPDNVKVIFINSTEKIGSRSSAIFEPDINYMGKQIELYKPDIILGCGKVAQEGLTKLGVSFISAPHPAWRQLSNIKINEIRSTIKECANV